MNLIAQLQAAFRPALAQLAPDPVKVADYLGMIRQAQNPDHGDYQANFAMPMGKAAGKKPQEMAADVIARLAAGDMLVHVFDPDTRAYYALEELWADAPRVDWERE